MDASSGLQLHASAGRLQATVRTQMDHHLHIYSYLCSCQVFISSLQSSQRVPVYLLHLIKYINRPIIAPCNDQCELELVVVVCLLCTYMGKSYSHIFVNKMMPSTCLESVKTILLYDTESWPLCCL